MPRNLPTAAIVPTSNPQIQAFKGSISCLPLKNGTYEDSGECALGLKTGDGLYYILLGLTSENFPKKDEMVEVLGSLGSGFYSAEGFAYKVSGQIQVTSIKKF